jgi:hypothetical protein
MRTAIFITVYYSIFFSYGCIETDVKQDAKQLATRFKQTIEQENLDFYKKDFAAWSKHFAQTESVYWTCVERDVTLRATGWNDLSQFVSQYMKENPTPDPDSLLKLARIEDFQIEVSNGIAFTRYKNYKKLADGSTQLVLENRVFQKINDAWKIVGLVSTPGDTSAGGSQNIYVHSALGTQTK